MLPFPPRSRRCFLEQTAQWMGGAAMITHGVAQASDSGRSESPTHEDTFALLEGGGQIPVIFDTDIGSDIDDTWALLYLLRCPELKTVLVTTDAGKGEYRASLTAKFLQACDRTDVPIGVGVGDPKARGNQRDWLGSFHYRDYAGEVRDNAVDTIIETVHASDVPVTLICVGAVPNIAAALRKDPSICKNARFVGMHGSIRRGYGNSQTPVPEANVRTDPSSLRSTFAADWNCSVTPLDTCGIIELSGDRYQRMRQSSDDGVVALMQNYDAWLRRVTWLDVKPDPTIKSSTLFDLVAVYMAYSETWLEMETLPLTVDDRGMTIVDPRGDDVRCAMGWRNLDAFLDSITERMLMAP